MSNKINAPSLTAIGLTLLLSSVAALAGDPPYRVVDLPEYNNRGESIARAINNAGQITGNAGELPYPLGSYMFRFVEGGEIERFAHRGYDASIGYAINARGQIAGTACQTPHGVCEGVPVRHTPGEDLLILGVRNRYTGDAAGINRFGDVAGNWHGLDFQPSTPYLYTDERGMIDLPFAPYQGAIVHGVNDAGQVIGNSYTNSPVTGQALLWTDDVMQELGTLGGNFSRVKDINELGVVVGWADTTDGERHAYIYEPDTGMTDLHPDVFANFSEGLFVNDAGMVAIHFSRTDNTHGAGLSHPERGYINFDFGFSLASAELHGMNERGVVVGHVFDLDFSIFPFVWDPEIGLILLAEVMEGHLPFDIVAPLGVNDHDQLIVSGFVGRGGLLLTPNGVYTLEADMLRAGQSANFMVTDATPNAMQYLVYSLAGPGETEVGALGVTLDLHQPRLAVSAMADETGSAQWNLLIPRAARGKSVWLQTAESGATTPVVYRMIE